jgi:outer membrane protein assembly factor BamE
MSAVSILFILSVCSKPVLSVLSRLQSQLSELIDPALVEQLEIGMSRNQVEFLLGTPSIVDLHHPDQWFYVFYLKTGDDGDIQKSVMTLTFTGNLLSMIDGDLNPG